MIRSGLKGIFANKAPINAQISGFGSHIAIHFSGPEGSDLLRLLYFYLLGRRIYTGARGFLALNLMHEQGHVERVLVAFQNFADEVLHNGKQVASFASKI
jgi:glutamate-1-semialdehyde 2,1-aminomutase